MLAPHGPLDREAARAVRRLVRDVDLSDTRRAMGYGVAAQAALAAISDRLLALARAGRAELTDHLLRIRGTVQGIGADEILGTAAPGLLGMILRGGASPRARLDSALAEVEAESAAIRAALPAADDRIAALDALRGEAEAARRAVQAHVVAGEVALAHCRAVLVPAAERRVAADAAAEPALQALLYNMGVLERRLEALRTSRAGAATDAPQIAAMKDGQLRLIEAARGTVLDLVGLWKRQCGAALMLLQSRRTARLDEAAAALLDSRDRLVAAIDASAG
nr:toxic anion resistance protein [Roseomonas acroporae]